MRKIDTDEMRPARRPPGGQPLVGGIFLLFICLVSARAALADDGVVLRWNDALLQAVRNTRFAPPQTARALGVVHTCMYDAWAAYDPVAVGTQFGGRLRRPRSEHVDANKERAISYAAYRALVDLFPTQKTVLFDPLMASLGYDPQDDSTDRRTPTGIGNVAAAAVLDFRHRDGSNQLGDRHPGAYSDYTGYEPVNDADNLNDPNRWQPLRNSDGSTQKFLAPHWGRVTPFALSPSSEFRPQSPPLHPHDLYRREAKAVLDLSAELDDRKKTIAEYWADGPGSETPPGHWNLFAQFVSERDDHTLDEDVKMFFALGNALLDASVSVWECKRFYDYVRPVSAIRFLYDGKQVKAWGGPYQGTQNIDGADFQTYIPTPPFAEYVSGHSTFSAASAAILKSFTKSDTLATSATIPAGSSKIEPGAVPASDVTLSWDTFSAAADEAGISRRYGGIHFERGDLEARAIGRKIGAAAWARAQAYFKGTAGEDDDDFDDDDVRDDIDQDDDNDGSDDEADSDDDNDGRSDEDDSDDDNDDIDDSFDSESHREFQTSRSDELWAGQEKTYDLESEAGALLLIATAEAAANTDLLSQPLTVEIYDPTGTLVASSPPTPGRAVATTVPVLAGTYSVRIRNIGQEPIAYKTLSIVRQNWVP